MMRICELEKEVENLKLENKMMQKNHKWEMRSRDLKEVRVVCVLCGCVLLYACVAMITRAIF